MAVSPRRLVTLGAVATVTGLAIAATAPLAAAEQIGQQQTIGGVILLAGWAGLAWAIHRVGREREA